MSDHRSASASTDLLDSEPPPAPSPSSAETDHPFASHTGPQPSTRRTRMMSRSARKTLLTVHIFFSVGWIGAVLAYLAINIVALTSSDDTATRGAYLLLDPILRYCITPMGIITLFTGIALGLGTRWGLLTHRWVAASLWLTLIAVFIMISHIFGDVAELTRQVSDGALDPNDGRADLPHTIASIIWLTGIMVLNIYKPRGLTRRGRRLQERASAEATT